MNLGGVGEREMTTGRIGRRDAHGREWEERQSEIGGRAGSVHSRVIGQRSWGLRDGGGDVGEEVGLERGCGGTANLSGGGGGGGGGTKSRRGIM